MANHYILSLQQEAILKNPLAVEQFQPILETLADLDRDERRGGIQLVAQQVEQVVRKLHGMAWVGTSLKQSYGQP